MFKGVIYCYTFPNGKVYIGQTINPRSRKQQHLSEKTGARNVAFWRAFKKYGTYEYSELEVARAETREELADILNLLEQKYIDKYDSMNPDHGYNLTSGGKVCVISDEAKQRMSDARTDKVSVLQYDLNGNFIAEHGSCVDAAKAIKSHAASIHACCTGKRGREQKKSQIVKGYTFRFKSDYPDVPLHIDLEITSNKKGVLQYTTQGDFVREWDSIMSIQKELGVLESNIRQCIYGKTRKCAGYMWRFRDEFDEVPQKIAPMRKANYVARFTPEQLQRSANTTRERYSKPVCQFDLDGHFIEEYPSLKAAGRAMGVNSATITNACKCMTSKTALGYQWRMRSDVLDPSKGIEPYIIHYGATKAILQLSLSGKLIKEWACAEDVAEYLRISRNFAYIIIRNAPAPYKGYVWTYKGNETSVIAALQKELFLFDFDE